MGPVPPSRFVPLAERHGLIDELTQWGLRTSLRQWLAWQEDGIDTCLAFNISALSLDQLDFPDLVERMCRALGVPTERLVLELTEGATQPLVKLMDTLTRFRIKGIGLAIDDFGVGYSTPDAASPIAVHRGQDRPLLRRRRADLGRQRADRQMHHRPRPRPRPDGHRRRDRDPGAIRLLCELGCDVAQGYLIARPLEPEALKPWIAEWRKRWPTLIAPRARARLS